MLKAYILATQICKIFLGSRIVLRVRQVDSKGGRTVKITLCKSTIVIFLCNDKFNITLPNLHGIYLQCCSKDVLPQYTHFVCPVGLSRRHYNVTHIRLKRAMHGITSIHF